MTNPGAGSGSQSRSVSPEGDAVWLIGWDAAVDPRNTALTLVRWSGGGGAAGGQSHGSTSGSSGSRLPGELLVTGELQIEAHVAPRDHQELLSTVSGWAQGDRPTLLCVDSPLGWPERMAGALAAHLAGAGLGESADQLFRRLTDIDVRRRVGKTPLDVGADRIARTALATLNTISSVRERVAHAIEVPITIRDPRSEPQRTLLLESYPAGWFASEGIVTRGYRPVGGRDQRWQLLEQVEQRLRATGIGLTYAAGVDRDQFTPRADDLDALVCTLNGVDYLLGRCPAPTIDQRQIARREGWIWCKNRE